MTNDRGLIDALLVALEQDAKKADDETKEPEDRSDVSTAFARARTSMRRAGLIEGRACAIRDAGGGCFFLEGFRPGDWVLTDTRELDSEADVDETQQKRRQYCLLCVHVASGLFDEEEEQDRKLHLIKGMSTAEEANTFFDQHRPERWKPAPAATRSDTATQLQHK